MATDEDTMDVDDEKPSTTAATSEKSTNDLAKEGLKIVEETINAGHQILSALNDELSDALLWSPATTTTNDNVGSDSNNPDEDSEIRGQSVEAAGHRFMSLVSSLVSSLRSVIEATIESQKVTEAGGVDGGKKAEADEAEVRKLEERAEKLRKELQDKNKILKDLIDQLRELISDISLWQSPCSL